jgi:hypothetical protein
VFPLTNRKLVVISTYVVLLSLANVLNKGLKNHLIQPCNARAGVETHPISGHTLFNPTDYLQKSPKPVPTSYQVRPYYQVLKTVQTCTLLRDMHYELSRGCNWPAYAGLPQCNWQAGPASCSSGFPHSQSNAAVHHWRGRYAEPMLHFKLHHATSIITAIEIIITYRFSSRCGY